MWKHRLVLAGVLLAGVAATALVGLASIRGEPARQTEKPPAAKSESAGERHVPRSDQPYTMRLSNGLEVPVYSADPQHKFETTDWIGETPLLIRSVHYDPKTLELDIGVQYSWFPSDEEVLHKQLLAKYVEAGHALLNPEALAITRLNPDAYRLIMVCDKQEYELYSTDASTRLSSQMIHFHLPMGGPEAENLHHMLSDKLETVELVLRSGVQWERVAGFTLERSALKSSWSKVSEIVRPPDGKASDSLLVVGRIADQEVRRLFADKVEFDFRSWGLTTEEEAAFLAKAREDIKTHETAPLTIGELLRLEQDAVVWDVKAGKIEAAPDTINEALTELHELRSREAKIDQFCEKISDLAASSSSTVSDERFHDEASRLLIDANASGSYIFFSAEAGLHLDKAWSDVEKNSSFKQAFQSSRAYLSQKEVLRSACRATFEREAKGMIQNSKSLSKLLDIQRVSAASLSAQAMAGWTFERRNGVQMVWTDSAVPLVVAPPPIDPAVLADMERRLRDLEAHKVDPAVVAILENWVKDPANHLENLKFGGVYSVVSVNIDNPPGDHFMLNRGEDRTTDFLSPVFGRTIVGAWVERVNNLGSSMNFEVTPVIDGNRLKLHLKDSGAPGSRNAAFVVHVAYLARIIHRI